MRIVGYHRVSSRFNCQRQSEPTRQGGTQWARGDEIGHRCIDRDFQVEPDAGAVDKIVQFAAALCCDRATRMKIRYVR
jgi:hypothetical protein